MWRAALLLQGLLWYTNVAGDDAFGATISEALSVWLNRPCTPLAEVMLNEWATANLTLTVWGAKNPENTGGDGEQRAGTFRLSCKPSSYPRKYIVGLHSLVVYL
jgi:hypothetical protein